MPGNSTEQSSSPWGQASPTGASEADRGKRGRWGQASLVGAGETGGGRGGWLGQARAKGAVSRRAKSLVKTGHHRTSDHKCDVVGCTGKQGSLCGHTLEKCLNCKENDIAFSSSCVKKREAAEAARQSRTIGLAGLAPTSAARDMATGSNRVVFGTQPHGMVEGRGDDEEEMADVDEEEVEAAGEAREVTLAETETETATRTASDTKTEIGMGALATDD